MVKKVKEPSIHRHFRVRCEETIKAMQPANLLMLIKMILHEKKSI